MIYSPESDLRVVAGYGAQDRMDIGCHRPGARFFWSPEELPLPLMIVASSLNVSFSAGGLSCPANFPRSFSSGSYRQQEADGRMPTMGKAAFVQLPPSISLPISGGAKSSHILGKEDYTMLTPISWGITYFALSQNHRKGITVNETKSEQIRQHHAPW